MIFGGHLAYLFMSNLIFIDVYLAFESYQFDKKIKIFHYDGGCELFNKRLASHFQQ